MSGPSEVVSVIRHHVRPGSEAAYEAWTHDAVGIAQGFPGHQGVAVIPPPEGSRLYTVVLHFDTLEHLRGWLESETRQTLLQRIEPHLTKPGEVEIRPGLEVWLSPPHDVGHERRARPYKQFLVVLSVIYPLSMLVPLALRPLFDAMPPLDRLPVRSLASNLIIIGLMTYVIMPRYTRAVRDWLFEPGSEE